MTWTLLVFCKSVFVDEFSFFINCKAWFVMIYTIASSKSTGIGNFLLFFFNAFVIKSLVASFFLFQNRACKSWCPTWTKNLSCPVFLFLFGESICGLSFPSAFNHLWNLILLRLLMLFYGYKMLHSINDCKSIVASSL